MTEPERVAALNDAPETAGAYVLYWMQNSQRAVFNPALETAIAHANRRGLPVLVGFGLTEDYPEANARHYAFMLEGLAETMRSLRGRGLDVAVRLGCPDQVALDLARQAALVVCDRGYLRPQREWYRRVAAGAGRRVLQVEGDVVVPVDLVSNKAEVAARTLRPKLMRRHDAFLRPLARQPVHVPVGPRDNTGDLDLDDVPGLLSRLRIDRSVGPAGGFRGGYAEARRRLDDFIAHRLGDYVAQRAQPAVAAVSALSPYLHFGQMSPAEVALAVRDAAASEENRLAYLEELVVRRELAVNFVNATPDYDSYEAMPEWARRTLAEHRRDPRRYLYDFDQLAAAATHDPYWNAAMREALLTGCMHNHLRMYWGKKVLEWSRSPEEGYETLLRLNNRYFIDGRDANSYANVGWVFGLHDRPWPERPVFGKVRTMTAAGLERKTNIAAYVRKIAALG